MLPPHFTPEYLRTLELLRLRSRRAYLGTRQGGHVSLKRGHGIEFSDYRKYELGDDPRAIDWGVYARSDRLYVKRFQEEQELTVFIILDTTNSMLTPPDEGKWELARDIALSLSYIALMEQDSVVLAAPGHLNTPHFFGGRAVHHIGRMLMNLKAGDVSDFVRQVHHSLSRVRFPGVAIFISDFLIPFEDTRAICNAMRAKNFDINAIQVLSPSDLNPLANVDHAIAVDSETGQEVELAFTDELRDDYHHILEEHNRRITDYFTEAGISYTRARSDVPVNDFITQNLSKTGLLS